MCVCVCVCVCVCDGGEGCDMCLIVVCDDGVGSGKDVGYACDGIECFDNGGDVCRCSREGGDTY